VNEKMNAYILTSLTEYFWVVIAESFVNLKKNQEYVFTWNLKTYMWPWGYAPVILYFNTTHWQFGIFPLLIMLTHCNENFTYTVQFWLKTILAMA